MNKLLLFTCCAPCVLPILEYLKNGDFDITLFFDNSNIDTYDEFVKRLKDVEKVGKIYGCKVIISEYMHEKWLSFLKSKLDKSLDSYVENGERCNFCLLFRTKNTIDYALNHGYDFVSSTFITSRYKNVELVKKTFIDLTQNMGVKFFDISADKNYLYNLGIELCKKYNIYRQKYCGCEFSKNI